MKYLEGAEILWGFCEWCATRDRKEILKATSELAYMTDLISRFSEANGLDMPREGWTENLLFPIDETATGGNPVAQEDNV